MLVRACVGNNGTVAAGPFEISLNGYAVTAIGGLRVAAETCVDTVFRTRGSRTDPAAVMVDSDDEVVEMNDNNNVAMFPAPNPTARDVPCGDAPEE